MSLYTNPMVREVNTLREKRTSGILPFDLKQLADSRTTSANGTKILNSTSRQIQRQAGGTPLSRLTGKNMPSPLNNQLRTHFTSPNFDDGMSIFESESNMELVVNRQVKAIHSSYPSLEVYDLAILHKHNEGNLNACRIDLVPFTIQCNPLQIVPPAVLNQVWAMQQDEEAQRHPQIYRTRTPLDYMKDYVIDGVPQFVSPIHDRQSIFECGALTVEVDALAPNYNRLVTMLSKGPTYLNSDYFEGNVKPGSTLYAVIKKFEPSDYASQGTLHCLRNNSATIPKGPSALRPYQMGFFSLPNGGPVPDEYKRYYDEEGVLRTDGHVIYLGMVMEVPQDHFFKEYMGPLKPYTKIVTTQTEMCGRSLSSTSMVYNPRAPRRLYRVIFDCDQGLMPF
jgi:hypothetical protein